MKLKGQYKGTRKRQQWQPRTLSQIFGIDKFGYKEEALIDRNEFFQGFLKADDFKNGQLLKIDWFDRVKTRQGIQAALRFNDYDKPFSLNATNLDFLLKAFGNDEEKWKGRIVKVRLEPVENFKTGKYVTGVRLEKGKEKE